MMTNMTSKVRLYLTGKGLLCTNYSLFCKLDASVDDGSIGRLVNDEVKAPNCYVKIIPDSTGLPHLCLFANRNVTIAEELRYNYGKGIPFPWRV